MRFFWQPREPHACQWRTRLEDAARELGEQGHTAQYVLIGRVLEIIDPEHKLAVPPPPPDPRADPLLGTLPVTAPEPGEQGSAERGPPSPG